MEIFGIDVGGSGVKGAPVNIETGELLAERVRIETPQPSKPEAVAKAVKTLLDKFNWKGPVGCGFPMVISNGKARFLSNLDPDWTDVQVDELFSEATGCPFRVVNDADAAGLAEMTYGVGKGKRGTVIMITIGTGLGSGFFRLHSQNDFPALSHLPLFSQPKAVDPCEKIPFRMVRMGRHPAYQ